MNYERIILNGLLESPGALQQYFDDEASRAESDHISRGRFIENLKRSAKYLQSDFQRGQENFLKNADPETGEKEILPIEYLHLFSTEQGPVFATEKQLAALLIAVWKISEAANIEQPKNKPRLPAIEQPAKQRPPVEAALKLIDFLSGLNPQKEKIMQGEDFDRLKEYTTYLIEHEAVPPNIKPIPQINISNGHIRYTYYRIHKEIYTTRHIKQCFILFLHTVFSQFGGTEESTTKTKFSTPPKSYDADVNAGKNK
jgi:hypothetical protein